MVARSIFSISDKNIFVTDDPRKTFYYPSPPRILNRKECNTAIQVENSRDVPPPEHSLENEAFLEGANVYNKFPSADQNLSVSDFNESWPSTECSTNEKTPERHWTGYHKPTDFNTSRDLKTASEYEEESGATLRKPLCERTQTPETSVLSRYLERFRHGKPMSREEREKCQEKPDTREFWWLHSAEEISHKVCLPARELVSVKTEKLQEEAQKLLESVSNLLSSESGEQASVLGGKHAYKIPEEERKATDSSSFDNHKVAVSLDADVLYQWRLKKWLHQSRSPPQTSALHIGQEAASLPELLKMRADKQVKALQEKTKLLMENTDSLRSSEPIVSTEGLGSTPSSSTSREDIPYRPAFAAPLTTIREIPRVLKISPDTPFSSHLKPRPEDDILYQWRAKRRIQLAREAAQAQPPAESIIREQLPEDRKLEEFRQKLLHFISKENLSQILPLNSVTALSDGTSHRVLSATAVSKQTVPSVSEVSRPNDSYPLEQPKFTASSAEVPNGYMPAPGVIPLPESIRVHRVPQQTKGVQTEEKLVTTDEDSGRVPHGSCRFYSQNVPCLPVAGPHIHQQNDVSTHSVAPHLHLQCHILPCKDHCHPENMQFSGLVNHGTEYKKYLVAERPDDAEGGSPQAADTCPVQQKELERTLRKESSLKKKISFQQSVLKEKENELIHSSSPKQMETKVSSVTAAIGQVVRQQTFETPMNSVLTSRNSYSLDTAASSQRSEEVDNGSSGDGEGESFSSDSEEFADDPFLQHLRLQRTRFEMQLRCIDCLLNESETGK